MRPPKWAFIIRPSLRDVVLSLLSDKAMNGAEIIRAVEEVTWGVWRPSPGSVYPLLKQLEGEGLVQRRQDGRYELTEAGRRAVRQIPWMRWPRLGGPKSLDEAVEELESWVSYLADLAVAEPERIAPFRERLRQLGERLQKI